MPLRKRGRFYGGWDTIHQMKQFPRTAGRKRNFQGLLMVTLIAVLATGVFAGWMNMREEDGYMRSALLRQARLFAETVSMGGIQGLKGDASDLSRPEYRRLKDQFVAAADIFRGSRFLYLVGRRPGGDVFFYLDSEKAGSENESLPGQVYSESDPRFLPVFEESRPVVAGPVSDRWGTWVSAWHPVVDPASGGDVAAIVIDFDAEYWLQTVRNAAILPNIVAALLAAMLYAGFITIKGRKTREEDTKPGFRHAEAVLVLYLGILVSLVSAQFMHGQDLKRQRESFEIISEAKSTELNIRIHRIFGQSLRALGGFIEASDLITRDEFHIFAGYFSNTPGVESALWIPSVNRKDRVSFEKSAGSEYGRKFFISDRNGEGGFSPAGERETYFPVLYSWPDVTERNIVLGMDLDRDPLWKEAMRKTAESGVETAAVVPFPPSGSSSPESIAALRPVFGGGGILEGYAVMTHRPDFLVNNVLDGMQGLLSMRLWRFMPDGEPRLLADSSFSDPGEAHFERKEISSGGDLCCIRPVLFLGGTFIAEVHPGDEFYTRHPSRTGWITLVSGILVTLSVVFLVHSIVRREEILEKKVDQRTAQLRESESRFRSLIEDAPFPVAVITPDGKVLFSNAQAADFFGVPAASVIGKKFTEEYSILEHPENFPGFAEALRSRGSIRAREAHFRKSDGSSVWGLLSARAFLFGEREAILVALQDITERKTLFDRLQLSSQIFRTPSEGILVTDANMVIEDCNPALENLTGYSLEEIKGEKTEMFSAQKDSPENRALQDALEQKGAWQGEMWNRHKNGEAYPVWITVTSVKDGQGVTTHYAAMMTHIGAFKDEQLRLGHLASHDLLTGLPNRMLLLDRLEMALARAKRDGSLVAVIFIDLDGFKEVNDVYGHETGDILLSSVAERLSASIREQDTAARYGGDEFVIVLDGIPGIEDANTAFHRISLAFCVPFDVRGMALSVGGSMGMSLFPMDGNDAGELLSKADMRMYSEKSKNKTGSGGVAGETGARVSPTRGTGGVLPGK